MGIAQTISSSRRTGFIKDNQLHTFFIATEKTGTHPHITKQRCYTKFGHDLGFDRLYACKNQCQECEEQDHHDVQRSVRITFLGLENSFLFVLWLVIKRHESWDVVENAVFPNVRVSVPG